VADTDLDVVERLRILGKQLFAVEADVTAQQGYQEVTLSSVRLARWWEAAGFAKRLPSEGHTGKGWTPHVPAAIRETNDKAVYAAFVRGLFEADGTVANGVPSVSTSSRSFASDVQVLMLTLALPTTVRETVSGFGGAQFQLRVRNLEHAVMYGETVGFLSDRKARLVATDVTQTGNRDLVLLPRDAWEQLVPAGHALRAEVLQNVRRAGGVPRSTAEGLYRETRDSRLRHALDYVFEVVAANEDGGCSRPTTCRCRRTSPTSPGGFVSHNTIGLMMDCDTTGLEPDLALVKFKKLVGGGSMQIVNQTVPRALRSLGYQEEQVEAIVEHIAKHGNVVDAPGLKTEHYSVFDCAMGERSIGPMGHVKMMAAIQPFVSGALSRR
jgi:ribonucleoside-diphosphate reductase alpha chain